MYINFCVMMNIDLWLSHHLYTVTLYSSINISLSSKLFVHDKYNSISSSEWLWNSTYDGPFNISLFCAWLLLYNLLQVYPLLWHMYYQNRSWPNQVFKMQPGKLWLLFKKYYSNYCVSHSFYNFIRKALEKKSKAFWVF